MRVKSVKKFCKHEVEHVDLTRLLGASRAKVEMLRNTAFTLFHQDWSAPCWAVIADQGEDLENLNLLLIDSFDFSDSFDFQDEILKLLEVNISFSMIPGEEYYISRKLLDSKDYRGMILSSDADIEDDDEGLCFSKEVWSFDDIMKSIHSFTTTAHDFSEFWSSILDMKSPHRRTSTDPNELMKALISPIT